mmetsp:Transcript_7556/g.11050  ORF Transcript_7556/g.11050 Transcript_7556/m.11050 type:complete len:227 (+) Transcript_7556:68-748(+)
MLSDRYSEVDSGQQRHSDHKKFTRWPTIGNRPKITGRETTPHSSPCKSPFFSSRSLYTPLHSAAIPFSTLPSPLPSIPSSSTTYFLEHSLPPSTGPLPTNISTTTTTTTVVHPHPRKYKYTLDNRLNGCTHSMCTAMHSFPSFASSTLSSSFYCRLCSARDSLHFLSVIRFTPWDSRIIFTLHTWVSEPCHFYPIRKCSYSRYASWFSSSCLTWSGIRLALGGMRP